MSLTIVLTEKLRSLPYFSDFKEESIEVPVKPFLRELLENRPDPGSLSIEELVQCVETCIYFGLDSSKITLELLWKIGETTEEFGRWFKPEFIFKTWKIHPDISPLIKLELEKAFGSYFTERHLIHLGIRCMRGLTCARAAEMGNLGLLHWAHVQGLARESTCSYAAGAGQLDCLKYAHEQGFFWDEWTCVNAARGGFLECLIYARKHGCPWNDSADLSAEYLKCPYTVCNVAAERGHLAILKYAHEQGCPWDEQTCINAASLGHLDCLKYAHEQGCPWTWNVYQAAMEYGDQACISYLQSEGCPR